MEKRHILFLFGISLVSVIVFSASSIDASSIPDWVKNTAGWWADGTISETEYISSLQYLINQGIISMPIPITEVVAATNPVSDADRAQGVVVRFSNGPLPTERPFTTFALFQSISSWTDDKIAHQTVYRFGDKPQFMLEGLPSKDKIPLYEAIDREYFAKAGADTIRPFDVNVDVMAGDGSMIQSWFYTKCKVFGYGTYFQDITNFYPFSGQEGGEFRDKILFECAGVRLQTP